MDVPFLKFVVKKLLYRFVFDPIHWVHLAAYCFQCILLEFYGVIPGSLWWVSFRFLFTEYFGKLAVFRGDFHLLCVLLCFYGKFCGGCCLYMIVVVRPFNLCDY